MGKRREVGELYIEREGKVGIWGWVGLGEREGFGMWGCRNHDYSRAGLMNQIDQII